MNKSHRLLNYFTNLIIPGMAILGFGIVIYFKVTSLQAWQYTSDIFIYNQLLDEMVFSGRPIDFTYGNSLGDHAYLFLYLFYPIKLLLKSNMIYFLLLFNPALYLISTLTLYKALQTFTKNDTSIFLGIAVLGGFGFYYKGLLEGIYGFHPDIAGGYLFIILTSSLIVHSSQKKRFSIWSTFAFAAWAVLIFIKEETVILSSIYFIILYLATKKKGFIFLGALSIAFTVMDFFLIDHFQTIYNRSNTALVTNLITSIKSNGLMTLFTNNQGPQSAVFVYWGFILGSAILFHALWLIKKKIDPYLLALFYTGLIKMGVSLLLLDFRITSWHNLPGGAMVISAILLTITQIDFQPSTRIKWVSLGLLLTSWSLFFLLELPIFTQLKVNNYERRIQIEPYKKELYNLTNQIPHERIMAVPMFSGIEFLDQRFTFYPGGVLTPPLGIADYIIFPKYLSYVYTGNFDHLYPIKNLDGQFEMVNKTDHFRLYKRISIPLKEGRIRQDFSDTYNLPELKTLP